MNKILLLTLSFLLIPLSTLFSQQAAQQIWSPVEIHEQTLSTEEQEAVNGIEAKYYKVDSDVVESILNGVTTEYSESVDISLPFREGVYETVHLEAYNSMHPALGKKYPYIKTYRGYHKGMPVYLTLSPRGIDAYMVTPDDFIIVEPVSHHSQTLYRRYTTVDFKDPRAILNCGLDDIESGRGVSMESMVELRNSNAVVLKYRLAMVATEAYSSMYDYDFDMTFASIVDLVNGMNIIFVYNLGIQLEMIENSDELIFTDIADDPYGEENKDGPLLLNSNTTVLYELIGGDNFDVGHVMTSTCTGGFAGVSRGSIVCNPGTKGAGVTCAKLTNSVLITTVHEFGHHFSADHTFNNCPPQSDQSRPSSGVEPGSGFTIMSYAGACGDQNLDLPRVDFFHVHSLEQMLNFSRAGIGSTCPEEIEYDHQLATVKILAEQDLYIPISTSFELYGEGESEESSKILYNFEQVDIGPASEVGDPQGNAPSFISQLLVDEPYREFPKRNYGLAHAFYKLEVLPTYSRDLTFRLTARDGLPGPAVWDEIRLHSTDEAGPFRVTSPNNRIEHIAGQKLLVEWDVANTDQDPVSCDRVDIYYSHNNGLRFDYLVAEKVKNNGSAEVFLPPIETQGARLKVKASNNVFFDYNERAFSVVAPAEPTYSLSYSPYFRELCTPFIYDVEINTEKILDYEGEVNLSFVEDLPNGLIAEFSQNPVPVGESTTLSFDLTEFYGNGEYIFHIRAESESDTMEFEVSFDATPNFYKDFALLSPADGESNVDQAPIFQWVDDSDADKYLFQISDSPDFKEIILERELVESEYQINTILAKAEIYYWRVRPINICGHGPWSDIHVFRTVQQECSTERSGNLDIFISPQGKSTVKGPLDIDRRGTAISVSVPNVTGDHSWVGNLTGSIESPNGTRIVLWDRECGNGVNFNMGFDDASPIEINCPLNNGRVFQPKEELSAFNGEEVNGQWNLIITDNVGGEVGVFKHWTLEVCFESQETPPNPYQLDTLRVKFNSERSLLTALRISHASFDPWDITLYPFILPYHGTLFRINQDGEEVNIELDEGFTMQEIYDNRILIRHNGDNVVYDSLRFYAITPDGGWTGAETLPIKYQEVVSIDDYDLSNNSLKVWPSPARDIIHIELEGKPMVGKWELVNMNGNTVRTLKVQNSAVKHSMKVNDCAPGMYILRWKSTEGIVSRKLIIQ